MYGYHDECEAQDRDGAIAETLILWENCKQPGMSLSLYFGGEFPNTTLHLELELGLEELELGPPS